MAFVQIGDNNRDTGTANVVVTLPGVQSGNFLVALVIGDVDQAVTLTTQAGSTGAWTAPANLAVWNATDTYGQDGYYAQCTATGDVTVRAAAASSSYLGLVVAEFSEITAFDTSGYVRDTTGGSPDGVAGQSLTPAANPSMRIAVAVDYASFPTIPDAGTNYTSAGTCFPFGGGDMARMIYRRVTGAPAAASDLFSDAAGTVWHVSSWIFTEISATLDLEGFRWGVDDGNEAAHGWEAAQDTSITLPDNQSRLLRCIVNNTSGDPNAIAYTLRYQKNGSGGYVAVPVGASQTTSPPAAPAATVTTIGTAADPWAINRPAANAGDMIVFVICWDDSTNVATVTAPAGVNSETAVSIAGPIASASTEIRARAWYYVATGAWTTGTLSFDPSAAETCRAVAFVIPAGQFNAADPIGFANTRASAGTAESNVLSPTGTAEGNDGSGRLYIGFGSDADALTAPAANWNTINNATGGGVGLLVGSRNALVTNSESIAALTATIASDSWATLCFVVKPNVVNNEVYIAPSANIAAGGEATTARLTAPSGSPTFTTGRRWDDENGTDTTDLAASPSYSEFEWLVALSSAPVDGDFFDFRVYAGSSALTSYGTTPRWTVGSAFDFALMSAIGTRQPIPARTSKVAASGMTPPSRVIN